MRAASNSELIVTIVDDDDDMRRSMERMIASVGRAVATFDSPEEFLKEFSADHCGCLILDLRLPGMSGMQLYHQLRNGGHVPPVIFVTGYGEIEAAVLAMRAGAWDFMEKPFSRNRLIDRINEAIEFDRGVRARRAELTTIEDRVASLTEREGEVLGRIMNGETTKEMAKRLGVSTKTVEGHRAHLFRKLHVNSLPQLALQMARLSELHASLFATR